MSPNPALDRRLARDFWHLVAHRSEVADDRDFVHLTWVLGDLVVYNDKGDIIAFDNVCPHRGARFFLEEAGNAPAVCPYHGWSYRGGEIRIPHRERYDACDLQAARLTRFQTAWCGDFLFVGVEPRDDLRRQLGGAWAVLEGMSRDISGRRDLNSYVYECPWRVAVENALEPDHVSMVHPASLGALSLSIGRNDYHGDNSILYAEVGNSRTQRSLKAMKGLFDLQAQFEGYVSVFVFPFAFVTSTFGYSYSLQTFMPSRVPERTGFTSRLLTSRLAASTDTRITDPFFDSVVKINRQVFEEDHEICRRISPDFSLDDPRRILSRTEEKVRHFRRSVAGLLQPEAPADNVLSFAAGRPG